MILPFFFLATLFPTTFGFGGLGHCLTGVIAAQLLTPEEGLYIQQFLDFMSQNYTLVGTLGEATRWADDIRSSTNEYDYWHYKQSCFSQDSMTRCSKARDPDSIAVINTSLATMLNKTASLDDKSFYLMFLIHLLGDIHQPLHNIRLFNQQYPRGDSGGNAISITYQGESGNLHEFWDSLCVMNPVNPSRPFSKKPNVKNKMEILGREYIANYTFSEDQIKFEGDLSTVQAWVQESYDLARNEVYDSGVVKNGIITDAYAKNCKKVLDRQLALAGRRLANVLKYLFKNKDAKTT